MAPVLFLSLGANQYVHPTLKWRGLDMSVKPGGGYHWGPSLRCPTTVRVHDDMLNNNDNITNSKHRPNVRGLHGF